MNLLSVKKKYSGLVSDYRAFMKELPDSFTEIGAMLPSSKYLARAMTQPMRSFDRTKKKNYRILEVGPGTGPFTRRIIDHLHLGDEFVVCEINQAFMKGLQTSLSHHDSFIEKQQNVTFFNGSVLDLPQELTLGGFDFIVCSLPFHNFDPEVVGEFLHFFESILNEGGAFSFFHYAGLRKISGLSPSKALRDRIKGVDREISEWCEHLAGTSGMVHKKVSMLNLPPAVAITIGS